MMPALAELLDPQSSLIVQPWAVPCKGLLKVTASLGSDTSSIGVEIVKPTAKTCEEEVSVKSMKVTPGTSRYSQWDFCSLPKCQNLR